jgi:transcriptional regulator with XRE-family HTH domain
MPDEGTEEPTLGVEAVAAEVRGELARRRMKQSEAASLIGMTAQAFNLRLQAKRDFRLKELVALAQALDVPVEQFLRPASDGQTISGGAA